MNTPPVGSGHTSHPNAPDYVDLQSKDTLQERVNDSIPQSGSANKGVVLTKDSLEVPLEQMGILNERSNTSRPTLGPLFRTRFVELKDVPTIDNTRYYQQLRSRFSPELLEKIEADPELYALFNASLQSEADLLVYTDILAQPTIESKAYLELASTIERETLTYINTLCQFIEKRLIELGVNDPSYDLLVHGFNQLKEGRVLLEKRQK